YAELALAPVGALNELRRDLLPDVAVARSGTGRGAMGILEVAAITADDLVVVPAAAGGLGALFVQAARRAGAGVVGLAGGEAKVELVRSLGADVAVDYRAEGWVERLRDELGDREPTLLLDGVGGPVARAVFDLLGPASRVVVFGWTSGEPLQVATEDLLPRGVQVTPIGPRILRRPGGWRDLEASALAAAADGTWTPLVTTFPLAKAADAHRALETRATTGKVVLVTERTPPPRRRAGTASAAPGRRALQRGGDAEHDRLAERRGHDLHADRQAAIVGAEGHRDRRVAGQAGRHRALVVHVHGERVGGLGAQRERRARRGRAEQHVEVLVGGLEVPQDQRPHLLGLAVE